MPDARQATTGVYLERGCVAAPTTLHQPGPDQGWWSAWDYVNPQLCASIGRPAELLTGLGWADALYADERAMSLNRWQAGIKSGAPFQVEQRLRGADGAYHWLRIQCAPWRNAVGTITRWAGIATLDESEPELATEHALRRTAEVACAERDRMIAITAHAFARSVPLSTIGFFLLQLSAASSSTSPPPPPGRRGACSSRDTL